MPMEGQRRESGTKAKKGHVVEEEAEEGMSMERENARDRSGGWKRRAERRRGANGGLGQRSSRQLTSLLAAR